MSEKVQQDAVDTYEEEEEVEITDDEGDVATEDQSEEEAETPAADPPTPQKKPGKVNPSSEVANMVIGSPENPPKAKKQTLPTNKNPFTTFGAWTEDTMSEIQITMPILTNKNESTNELTRATRPEARYWKGDIIFSFKNFTSRLIRFDNVQIPYHTGKGYGTNFVYLCLPGFAAEKFSTAGKSRRPTIPYEKSLQPDKNRWWKVANKVEDSFGIINGQNKKFQKKSLETIFGATNAGITASVVLSFLFKASTDGIEAIKPTTPGTISVVLERGFIMATDINVQMPIRLNTKKNKTDPTVTSRDVADDNLMKRLGELGL